MQCQNIICSLFNNYLVNKYIYVSSRIHKKYFAKLLYAKTAQVRAVRGTSRLKHITYIKVQLQYIWMHNFMHSNAFFQMQYFISVNYFMADFFPTLNFTERLGIAWKLRLLCVNDLWVVKSLYISNAIRQQKYVEFS